jgi:hypothetical protein
MKTMFNLWLTGSIILMIVTLIAFTLLIISTWGGKKKRKMTTFEEKIRSQYNLGKMYREMAEQNKKPVFEFEELNHNLKSNHMENTTKVTQEMADRVFASSLGQQLLSVFSTSDGRFFVRHSEAYKHAYGELDENTQPLEDKRIIEWFESEEPESKIPATRYDILRYKVIDEYPNSPIKKEEVLQQINEPDSFNNHIFKSNKSDILVTFPENYPHLFRLMEWHEERITLPQFIKRVDNGNTKKVIEVEHWENSVDLFYTPKGASFEVAIDTSMFPATEEEYKNFIASQDKF